MSTRRLAMLVVPAVVGVVAAVAIWTYLPGPRLSIGDVLRSQSEEMRVRWRQEAQERDQKAPVKILVPLVFCVFPATSVVILGPAAVKLVTGI